MEHSFNSSTQDAKAGRSLWVWGLHIWFQDSQGHIERPCLKKSNKHIKIISHFSKTSITLLNNSFTLNYAWIITWNEGIVSFVMARIWPVKCMHPRNGSTGPHTPAIVMQAYNPSSWEAEGHISGLPYTIQWFPISEIQANRKKNTWTHACLINVVVSLLEVCHRNSQ